VKAGDAARLAALYTEDAWLLPPGADIVRGRARIEEFWHGRFQRIAEVKLTTVDVVALALDSAREVGSSEIALRVRTEIHESRAKRRVSSMIEAA
jgi:ketosteroid isomerase-like protein